MSAKLEPCPFCREIPTPHPDYPLGSAYLLMHKDTCWFVHKRHGDKYEVLWDSLGDLDPWNRRAPRRNREAHVERREYKLKEVCMSIFSKLSAAQKKTVAKVGGYLVFMFAFWLLGQSSVAFKIRFESLIAVWALTGIYVWGCKLYDAATKKETQDVATPKAS